MKHKVKNNSPIGGKGAVIEGKRAVILTNGLLVTNDAKTMRL
jgi:hypothetical protein